MLALSRRPNERILIGKDIRITVIQIRGGAVRLGIETPKGVVVVREELVERNAA